MVVVVVLLRLHIVAQGVHDVVHIVGHLRGGSLVALAGWGVVLVVCSAVVFVRFGRIALHHLRGWLQVLRLADVAIAGDVDIRGGGDADVVDRGVIVLLLVAS